MILITSTERSGTMFLAKVLYKAGIDATHEGNLPGHDWHMHDPRKAPRTDVDVDVCWHSALWLGTEVFKDDYVVHLTRHPLEAISSSMHRNTFMKPAPSGEWAIKMMPWLGEGSNLERCTKYWLDWNKLIDPHAHKRVKIEDMNTTMLAEILNEGEIEYSLGALAYAFESIPKNTNTNAGSKQKLAWDDIEDKLLRLQLKRRALKYGY